MNRIIVSVWTRIENSVTLYAFSSPVSQGEKEAVKWAQFPDPKGSYVKYRKDKRVSILMKKQHFC